MKLYRSIYIDLAMPGVPPKVYAKQDDSGGSRVVVVYLMNNGVAYTLPDGVTFMLRYKTAQGAIGLYDTMPDGSAAMTYTYGSNVVDVSLVDQIFALPGNVECELRIIDNTGSVSTWTWIVEVAKSNVGDATIPSDYINVITNLASTAVQAANEAKAAAGSINTSNLMKYVEYDSTGEVKTAGGIAKFVEANATKIEPVKSAGRATDVNGSGAGCYFEWYRAGNIVDVSLYISVPSSFSTTKSVSFKLPVSPAFLKYASVPIVSTSGTAWNGHPPLGYAFASDDYIDVPYQFLSDIAGDTALGRLIYIPADS